MNFGLLVFIFVLVYDLYSLINKKNKKRNVKNKKTNQMRKSQDISDINKTRAKGNKKNSTFVDQILESFALNEEQIELGKVIGNINKNKKNIKEKSSQFSQNIYKSDDECEGSDVYKKFDEVDDDYFQGSLRNTDPYLNKKSEKSGPDLDKPLNKRLAEYKVKKEEEEQKQKEALNQQIIKEKEMFEENNYKENMRENFVKGFIFSQIIDKPLSLKDEN